VAGACALSTCSGDFCSITCDEGSRRPRWSVCSRPVPTFDGAEAWGVYGPAWGCTTQGKEWQPINCLLCKLVTRSPLPCFCTEVSIQIAKLQIHGGVPDHNSTEKCMQQTVEHYYMATANACFANTRKHFLVCLRKKEKKHTAQNTHTHKEHIAYFVP